MRSYSRQSSSQLTARSQTGDLVLKLSKLSLAELCSRVDLILRQKIEMLTSNNKEDHLENELIGQINTELALALEQLKIRNLPVEETKASQLDKKIEII